MLFNIGFGAKFSGATILKRVDLYLRVLSLNIDYNLYGFFDCIELGTKSMSFCVKHT